MLLATTALGADQKRPSLQLARLTGTPQKIATNARFAVGTTVENRGRAPSKAAQVRFLLARPRVRPTIGRRPVQPLAPGGVSRRTTPLRATVPPGTWRLVACVGDHCRAAKRTTLVTRRPKTTPPAPVTLTGPADGALLNERRPSIAGTAQPSAPVTVTIRRGADTAATVTTTPQADGRWSTAPAGPLADGAYDVRARQGDRISATRSFAIDATPPNVTIEHPADGGTTDLMAFDGQAGDGGPVSVRLSNGSELSAGAAGPGWSALAPPLAPGAYTLTAEQRDAAGNLGRATARFTVPFSLLAAGDVAGCDTDGDSATAAVLRRRAGTIAALGDLAYASAPGEDPFKYCYDPTWGQFKARTMPVPGNHEYEESPGAANYFSYWGAAGAGATGDGYYSYDVGAWHVIALNSSNNCSPVACDALSAQFSWLVTDLATHPAKCTLAYFHHPRFSAYTGTNANVKPLWQALYDGGADLVLGGHAHNYERFRPVDPDGTPNESAGITEIVAGTGGRNHHGFFTAPGPNTVVRDDQTFGILDLRLEPTGWSWEFLPAAGGTFTDAGSADCH
ncbi:MAG TPA: Ig-like domain-containing protein [Thermoleophilaceae bacterium]|nr:Ig-like domain-containing protein [Thermoleophilaceae bacterium]